jgi:hypothetical protein
MASRYYPHRLARALRKLKLPARVRRLLHSPWRNQMLSKWDYRNTEQFSYGDDTTYRKGMSFLDGYGTVEDWGCGTAYAKRFLKSSNYLGIDGSKSDFVDKVVDLRSYTSEADCIFMRHILEHNRDWPKILSNAVNSFQKRMVLIIFTPFSDETREMDTTGVAVPDISFRKEDVTTFFKHYKCTEESLTTDTQYNVEHVFYIEK